MLYLTSNILFRFMSEVLSRVNVWYQQPKCHTLNSTTNITTLHDQLLQKKEFGLSSFVLFLTFLFYITVTGFSEQYLGWCVSHGCGHSKVILVVYAMKFFAKREVCFRIMEFYRWSSYGDTFLEYLPWTWYSFVLK